MDITFSVFIATSLDGYIARLNGKLDWLNSAVPANSKEDYGYHQYMAKIDCIVIGRRSFEKVVSFPQWPYQGKRVIVLSKTLTQVPDDFEDKVTLFNSSIEQLVVELQNIKVRHVYVDGGLTIQSFIRAGLLNELTITHVPVLIGKGLPLFADVAKDVKLKLLHSRHFNSGFVQSHYLVERSPPRYFD